MEMCCKCEAGASVFASGRWPLKMQSTYYLYVYEVGTRVAVCCLKRVSSSYKLLAWLLVMYWRVGMVVYRCRVV